MEYTLVQATGLKKFIERVNDLTKQGWTPTGGVMMYKAVVTIYAQAMVK